MVVFEAGPGGVGLVGGQELAHASDQLVTHEALCVLGACTLKLLLQSLRHHYTTTHMLLLRFILISHYHNNSN